MKMPLDQIDIGPFQGERNFAPGFMHQPGR